MSTRLYISILSQRFRRPTKTPPQPRKLFFLNVGDTFAAQVTIDTHIHKDRRGKYVAD